MAMVDYWIEGKAVDIDYSIIPAAVFTQPNVSTVGMTEDQAIEQNVPVKIFRADFKHMKHSLTGRDDQIFMKMLVHAETDKVLGLHAIGPDVGEMIQTAAVAITAGATKAHFDRTIGIHPTMAEELVTMRTERAS
jgi:glutathione reductase (NADPH)